MGGKASVVEPEIKYQCLRNYYNYAYIYRVSLESPMAKRCEATCEYRYQECEWIRQRRAAVSVSGFTYMCTQCDVHDECS